MSRSFNNLAVELLTPKPKEVEGLNNSSYFYYYNQLYTKINSLFNFKNLPENWDISYIKDNLFRNGYLGIVELNGSTWPLICGYSGINMYNNPIEIIIANPVLGSFSRKIGENGELLYFNRVAGQFLSVDPLVTRYAVLLRQCDRSLNVSLMNSRVAHVFEGENDAEVASYKKMYDEVSRGKPAVFLKKGTNSLRESNFNFLNVRNTYIGNDVLLTKRTIMNEFLTEIGVNNANTDKRERLNTDEVNANNSEIQTNITQWLDTMKDCIKRINKTLGLNIDVELNKHIYGGEEAQEVELEQSNTALRLSNV